MFDQLKKYKNKGHFFVQREQKLPEVNNAPEKAGVFYVMMLRKGKIELVYIGASGAINQKGVFGLQQLKSKIVNQINGENVQQYFEKIILITENDTLDIS